MIAENELYDEDFIYPNAWELESLPEGVYVGSVVWGGLVQGAVESKEVLGYGCVVHEEDLVGYVVEGVE